ncbi:MAG: sugar transferase [Anaerolineae bacterium]|nr:sugar transferase [Anaerolineae bacterium]
MLETQPRMATWYEESYHPVESTRDRSIPYERVKRAFDVALAAVLLVLLSPLLVIIAVAIKVDSHGPVLFVQRRTGRYARPFNFFKFRSMSYGANHADVHREYARRYANGADDSLATKGLYKPQTNGQEVTRIGRLLRMSSLDELPQLYNILRGDMSFVGPRAWADYELENYKDWHFRRLEVLPGLTGLAQISGRSALAFDEIIRLDIEYIDNRSMQQDIKIMLRTIPVVAAGNNSG